MLVLNQFLIVILTEIAVPLFHIFDGDEANIKTDIEIFIVCFSMVANVLAKLRFNSV